MQSATPGIFVSYARADAAFALKLATDLRTAGTSLWLDQLDIRAGDLWDRDVEDALRASPCMLVILSRASVASQNVMDEVAFALSENKRIVPVRLEQCGIPLRLTRLHYVDFSTGYDEGLARLTNELAVGYPHLVHSPVSGRNSPAPVDISRTDADVNAPRIAASAPPAPAAVEAPGSASPWVPQAVHADLAPARASRAASEQAPPMPPSQVNAGDAVEDALNYEEVAGASESAQAPVGQPTRTRAGHLAIVCGILVMVIVGIAISLSGQKHASTSTSTSASSAPPATEPPGAAATPATPAWTAGERHTEHPHVIKAATEDKWMPDEGYVWVDGNAAGDLRVQWQPGKDHTKHPHVVAAEKEGDWKPAAGYAWIDKNAVGDFRVTWSLGIDHPNSPNVVAADDEGKWRPAPGYEFITSDPGDFRVRRK